MLYTGKEAKKIVHEILESIDDNGRYPYCEGDSGYYKDGKVWCAWDNSSGDCWVEEFKTKKECIDWINQV